MQNFTGDWPSSSLRPQPSSPKNSNQWSSRERLERTYLELQAELRSLIQREKAEHTAEGLGPSPRAVAAFAMLHMQTESGIPIAPAAHHKLWLKLICELSIPRLLIIATPESAKTTWALAFVATLIGYYPEWPGIIAASSGSVAEKRSLSLRNIVESPQFQATFPEVITARGLPWKIEEWSVAPNGRPHPGRLHPTVSAYGTGGAITGSRARWLVADDLLDYDNTRTSHQRNLVDNWFHTSLLSRVGPSGIVRVIGNAWHHDDSHARLRRSEGWVTCHIPLLSEGAEVVATITYPENFIGQRLGEPVVPQAAEKRGPDEDV